MGPYDLVFSGLAFLVSYVVTYLLTPKIIEHGNRIGLVGVDLHKPDGRRVVRVGGIAILMGFLIAVPFSGFLSVDEKIMIGVSLSGVLGCLIGFLDDLFSFDKRTIVAATFVIALPLIAFRVGSTMIYLTPFGPADMGIYFWALMPLVFAFLANAVNIYAGFNGLEAGLGLITATSLGVASLIYGSFEAAFTLFSLAAALVAFLRWNRYPAQIFLGNSGTYLIGSVVAVSVIVGSIKLAGVIACMPYVINFLLRAWDRFRWSVGETTSDGLVVSGRLNALWAVFMYKRPRSEADVVRLCWLLQAFFGALSVAFSYYQVNLVRL